MIKLKDILNESLPTKEIDPKQFKNPETNKDFLTKGERDGSEDDDTVNLKPISIPASSLKPSQTAVYLGKALGMAASGLKGGDLGAVISLDNRILDGHHRWASTMFNDPSAKVGGMKADLKIGDLVPVLRAMGDTYGNKRRGAPGGDLNIFKATAKDALKYLNDLNKTGSKFMKPGQAIQWLKGIGGKEALSKRLKMIQQASPPSGAPERIDMPVIEPNQLTFSKKQLGGGSIDVRPPYAKK